MLYKCSVSDVRKSNKEPAGGDLPLIEVRGLGNSKQFSHFASRTALALIVLDVIRRGGYRGNKRPSSSSLKSTPGKLIVVYLGASRLSPTLGNDISSLLSGRSVRLCFA